MKEKILFPLLYIYRKGARQFSDYLTGLMTEELPPEYHIFYKLGAGQFSAVMHPDGIRSGRLK